MKKIFLLSCILSATIIFPQNQTPAQPFKIENSIECLDTQAVKKYLETNTLADKRKALLAQHADDLVRLYRPTSLGKSFPDLARFAGGSLGTLMATMVLAIALHEGNIKLSKSNAIPLDKFLTLAMIPICGVAGYLLGKLALRGWQMECAHEKFNKAREIQYLLHGVSAA